MISNRNETIPTKMPTNEFNYSFPQIAQIKRSQFDKKGVPPNLKQGQ